MTKAEYDLQKKKKYQEYKAGLITNYAYIQWKKKNDPSLNGGAASTSTTKNTATTMQDPGQEAADQAVGEMEKRLRKTYKQAKDEITKKLAEWSKEYADKDAEMQAKVASGEITQDEYQSWQQGQALAGKLWRKKLDQVSGVLLEANQQAMEIINKQKMGVFAENANYQSYQLTQDTKMDLSFAVYDVDAVAKLIRDQPELLPRKQVNGKKDKAWNQTKMANIAARAIIQGESIPQIARRIATETASDNMKAMVRYARTAMTSAQNAGRMETLHRAKGMGIQCKKVWLATLDKRTRDSHRNLDGQVRDIDEPFDSDFGKIMFPGDPEGHPGDVFNCRCTLTYQYLDYPVDPSTNDRMMYEEWDEEVPVKKKDKNGKEYKAKKIIHHRESKLVTDMTYNEWTAAKTAASPTIAQPKAKKATKTATSGKTAGTAPMSEKDALEYYVKHGEKEVKNLTKEEKKAVSNYGYNNLSAETNGYLRGETGKWESWQENDIKANIAILDQAIGKITTDDDLVLYRGVGKDYLGLDFSHPEKLIGKTVTEGGYMSTSGSIEAAEVYGRGVVLELQVPKGTNAAYVDLVQSTGKELLDNYKTDGDAGNIEYLLARGGQLKFTGYSKEKDANGKEYLKMKVEFELPQQVQKGQFAPDAWDAKIESRLQRKIDQAIETSRIAQGTDITGTWKRREDKFKTEIEDVINKQGFDGVPRVVSQEEFDKAVEESGLYAQRVYSAPTEEVLEAYRKELYGGKFYVDCSVGGADFGQGMYMSGDFTGKKVKDVMEDSDRYVAISESRGNKHSFVEKMTLDKDSKIVTYDSLLKEYQEESILIQKGITRDVGHKLVEEAVNKYGLSGDDRNFLLWGLNIPKEVEHFDVMKASKYSGDKKLINSIRNDISSKIKAEKSANPIISANGDMGIYGAMKGYDAINIEGQAANGTSQVLVLNRTKLIIRRAK